MFNDLTNETLNPIYTQNVKAYPSINSPNSGGFNDEINAKWVSKKFSSKSFIVNPETDFIRVYQTADTLVTTAGSVCVDGYMLKLSAAGKTSFDSDDSGNISVNTQYIQRFTDGLLGAGTDYPVKSSLSDILFSEYNPDSVEDSDYTTVNANWANATENNLCVGYVQITYYGTYFDQLTVSTSSVTYNGKTIPLRSYNLTYDSSPDNIKNAIGSDFGKAFALNSMISSLGSSVSIFYPISSNLSFVDIFGLKISLGRRGIQTKLYPYTMSPLMDMNTNEPLSSISFSDCALTTFPQNLYDFGTLYDENKDRYTFSNNSSMSFTVSDFPESSFFNTEESEESNGIFKYIQLQDLLNNYVPENQQNIRNIKNNLSYFVLNLDNTEYASDQIPLVNKSGVTTSIPVAFMTSAGNICPNGIISDETSTTYPVEGYLHFVKRVYLNIHGIQETETNINNVTVAQLCSDPEQNATWISWFNGFYSTILAKAICAYLHIAYCSIMDNVARYNMQNIADSLKIKAIGCGNALQSSSSVSQSDFYVTQQYSHTGYTYDSATDSFNTSTFTDDIVYRKDITSDNYKVNGCIGKVISDVSSMPISYLQAIDMTNSKNVAIAFGDPIEYIQNCVVIDSNSTVSMPIYKISSTGEIVNTVYTNSQQSTLTISNVYVDSNLMPLRNNFTVVESSDCYIPMATHQTEMLNGSVIRQSAISGLCVGVSRYTWVVDIPCLLKLHKDGQNYLAGKNFLDNTYSGCSITYDLSDATDDNSAFLYYMRVPQISSGVAPDYESKFIYLDTTSDSAKVNRNAFISVDRVYDPDGPSSLEAFIQNMMSGTESTIQQMQQTINNLQTFINRYATIMYYHKRIHIGDFDSGKTARPTPITQGIQSNSRIALKIDLYETANALNKIGDYSLITYQVTNTGAGVPTNYHNYNESVDVDYYYSQNDGDPSSAFGTVLITNTSNDSIDNILFDFQIYREKYSTLLPTDVSCDITTLAAIILDDNDLHKTLSAGDTDSITVDSTIPANQTVTWSSDNTNIVTVDQSGTITAIAAGTAKVTASLEVENATVFVSSVVTVQ